MSRLRITVVTYNWPPRNAIGTQRPLSWARHWSRLDDVSINVLTAEKHPFDEPLDLDQPTLPNVNVHEVRYGSATTDVMGSIAKSTWSRPAVRLYRAVVRRTRTAASPRAPWRAAARTAVGELAGTTDVVVSTYGPQETHMIAYDLKRSNPSMKWIADYRDLWSQNLLSGVSKSERSRQESMERATVGSLADAVTTVSAELADVMRDFLGKPTTVIMNGFEGEISPFIGDNMPRARRRAGPFRIVHTGGLFRCLRDPEPLLVALVRLHKEGLLAHGDVVVEFYGSRLEPANDLAKNPEYGPFINIMGHAPHPIALEAQRSAGLLLVLESDDPRARGVLTGKIFEYLAAGIPILALGVAEDSAISNLLRDTRAGIAIRNDTAALATVILAARSAAPPPWFSPDRTHLAQYSRNRQADRLLEVIRGVAGRPTMIRAGRHQDGEGE